MFFLLLLKVSKIYASIYKYNNNLALFLIKYHYNYSDTRISFHFCFYMHLLFDLLLLFLREKNTALLSMRKDMSHNFALFLRFLHFWYHLKGIERKRGYGCFAEMTGRWMNANLIISIRAIDVNSYEKGFRMICRVPCFIERLARRWKHFRLSLKPGLCHGYISLVKFEWQTKWTRIICIFLISKQVFLNFFHGKASNHHQMQKVRNRITLLSA